LSICNLSEIFDTIPNAVDTKTIGIITSFIKFPINVIINISIGCSILAEVIFPVVIISVINIGISKFINPTKFSIDSLTIDKISEKLVIIKVTISIY